MSIFVDIEKRLGAFTLNVKFQAGDETLALLGASGCGKSMTLRCIAGIEKPDRGKIILEGVTLFDSETGINLPPQRRHTGLMFQNYALFPNMTVAQDVNCGAKREKDSKTRKDMVESVMECFDLGDLADRYPHQLSGGQQQRVALARILVSSPKILLLDEPFSALDSHLRFRLEREVRETAKKFGKTVILVSHDRDEVYRMSDSIAIMEHGTITAMGTNREVFASPQTRGGASLTGCKFLSRAEKVGETKVLALDWDLELEVPPCNHEIKSLGIRMHKVRMGPGENHIRCEVMEEIENPFSYTLMLKPEGRNALQTFGWSVSRETWEAGRTNYVDIHIPQEAILLLRD